MFELLKRGEGNPGCYIIIESVITDEVSVEEIKIPVLQFQNHRNHEKVQKQTLMTFFNGRIGIYFLKKTKKKVQF